MSRYAFSKKLTAAFSPGELISQRTAVDPVTGCWVWAGKLEKDGYARLQYRGVKRMAHIWSYEAVNGPVPEGLCLDHTCKNRARCNPAHLEAVTIRVNTLRGDGPSAAYAERTHCKHGHPLSGDNVRQEHNRRRCLTCLRARSSSRRANTQPVEGRR